MKKKGKILGLPQPDPEGIYFTGWRVGNAPLTVMYAGIEASDLLVLRKELRRIEAYLSGESEEL